MLVLLPWFLVAAAPDAAPVAITYRGAEDGVGNGTGYDAAAEAVGARLFPDLAKFKAEEAKRCALVEEHWDVIVHRSE
ncbi:MULTISPECIES: hypothetical protein [unclassified Sphingopyxis]|uniref:hypothetical protein n=1 Tax=unclassified Sphingopyxis TaxID=2614943 RepID=UPI00285B7CE1|nr:MULTISPECIES: hypothetical protein [unclassified Sphingopyxis]MDR6833167.1 hypothetical protein [Sphingopyxis sp. BE122]MDR7228910.1 hypothetical protein [Sphingopyxis sp. BE259]